MTSALTAQINMYVGFIHTQNLSLTFNKLMITSLALLYSNFCRYKYKPRKTMNLNKHDLITPTSSLLDKIRFQLVIVMHLVA